MITLKNVTKRYGETTVLEHTDYAFPRNGLVCLTGPSGGGKTTLLNLIAGFDAQYGGEILAGTASLTGMTADELCQYRRDHVGFIFQNYHLLPGYTALENVLLPAELSAEPPEESQRRAKALLQRLGLGGKEQQRVETLSGGQKQRVAIARALLGDPQILLADEPTGALDRKTSTEIMELLQEIAREKLVVVITHDEKLLPFTDEVLRIENHRLVCERSGPRSGPVPLASSGKEKGKAAPFRRAAKNFRVHGKRYLAVAAAISIGLTAFLFSLSFGNVTQRSIEEFQQKNTVFNNGYLKDGDSGAAALLEQDERVENVYAQYPLSDIGLALGGRRETLTEKLPLPKTTESLSYGVMPRRGQGEIALSPSLAKKFSGELPSLLGQTMTLTVNGTVYPLTISGIYNAGYDDFFVSSEIERQFYGNRKPEKPYSLSYDVKRFEDIVDVSAQLRRQGLDPQDASKEVAAMQETFHTLRRLFLIVSALVLLAALFLCAALLFRLQNSRYRESGLLSALGFLRRETAAMIRAENLLLSCLAAGMSALLLGAASLICTVFHFPLTVGAGQFAACMGSAFLIILLVSGAASWKLLRTEPAEALRK